MSRESNYIEDASMLYGHSDFVISNVASVLMAAIFDMAKKSAERPLGHFNVRYFFLSFAQSIAFSENLRETKLAISCEECALIRAINPPTSEMLQSLSSHQLFKSQIAQRFIALTSEHSQEVGDEFDVSFALKIACYAINTETYDNVLSGRFPEKIDESFDQEYWASSFANPVGSKNSSEDSGNENTLQDE